MSPIAGMLGFRNSRDMGSIQLHEEDGVRYLQSGSHWIQGAMRIAQPWGLELDYTRQMMLPLLFRSSYRWPRRILQIGLGAGSISRFLHRHLPKSALVVVEIDPQIVMTAWQWFRLPAESARFSIELDDGYSYMATTRRRFDLILVDGFDANGRAGRLDSLAFYDNCRRRLARHGFIAVNLLGSRRQTRRSAALIARAFGDRIQALPPCGDNTVVLATPDNGICVSIDGLNADAARLKMRSGLDLLPVISRLRDDNGNCGALEF